MGYEVKLFEHAEFGKIRVITINGEPLFAGKDVATALKYSDTFSALKQHVPDKFKRVINAKTLEQMASQSKTGESPVLEFDTPRGLTFINEAGLYKLIFRSNLPKAEEFSDWVCEEVLPSIRKTGSYSLVKPEPAHVPNPNRRAGQLKDACVYVAKVNNNTVKVGQSCNVKKRRADIKSKHKIILGETHKTVRFPRKIARVIEQAFKDIFSSSKLNGEFFSVSFDIACNVLNALEKLIESLPIVSDKECDNKLLKISEMMSETSERQNLLANAADIFVDKKTD